MGTTVNKKLVLPPGLGNYAAIFKPRAYENQDPKFSIVLSWPKAEKESLTPLIQAIVAAAKATFGEEAVALLKNGKLKNPLRDGDTETGEDGKPRFPGQYFLTASAKADRAPQIVDAKVQPVFEEGEAYSGCTFRASVNLFTFEKKGNRGVAVGLNNLQVVKKGPRLDGRKSAEEDFAAFKEEGGGSSTSGEASGADDLL